MSMEISDNFDLPANLEALSKEELIKIIKHLQDKESPKKNKDIRKKSSTPFDFKKYKKRHVALKFLYLGWEYSGFTVQIHTEKTIEAQLFNALEKTKLLESRETSNYHRCGRTDKGVSAFCQVISLDLRTNLNEGKGVITPDDFLKVGSKVSDKEIDYPSVLNRVLPPEIRVIGWAPVDTTFSARFDCKQRTYKYWLPLGDLDISIMREAAQKLVGEHDFRNFCKMDVGNGVINYKRRIFSVDIQPFSSCEVKAYDIIELTVVGQAFLWHQIRCIISVLFLIGQGKEDCQIVDQLLDIESCPRKPQYNMASEIPLVLFDCAYDNIEWIYNKESLKLVIKHLQSIWTYNAVKTVITRKMLQELEKMCPVDNPVLNQVECLLPGVKPREYKCLLDRQCCESLEERIEHYNKKIKTSLKS
ncbi:tRNA pseudouridine(38/39) synthase, partial [Stegodyphus mimosarum]